MSKTTFITSAGTWGSYIGLKIPRATRDSVFNKNWKTVQLQIGTKSVSINLTPSFWKTCHEFRHQAIHQTVGHWLQSGKLPPWKYGEPPKIKVQHLGGNKFKVLGPAK